MLPTAIAERLDEMRGVLERCCPVVASIRIRLSLQSLITLVERDRRVLRAVRLTNSASLQYGYCRFAERDQPRREIVRLLDRLERSLLDAKPSAAAVRLGREW